MLADSGLPFLRGTRGLWEHYPAFKKEKITFDDFIHVNFFRANPAKFWYVFG